MAHDAPAARELPHALLAMENAAAFVPPIATEEIPRAALPALESVNGIGALVVPTVTVPKSAVLGLNAACGAPAALPLPVSVEA